MKQITLTAFILNIIVVWGHVTFSTKTDDVTTFLPENKNGTDSKYMPKINSFIKLFNVNNNTRAYLDDVVFALKIQDWTKEEEPCLNRTLLWLKNLQNFTLWAVWNWDSLSSEPQGMLYGSRYHLGNYDECMKPPWYKDHPDIRSQYCLADIVINGADRLGKKGITNPYDPYQSAFNWFQHKSLFLRTFDVLTWGVCVPDVCQPRSVERLVRVLLAHSHLGVAGISANITVNEECQKPDHPRPFDTQFYAFVGVAVVLIALCLVSTYLNHNKRDLDKKTLSDQFIGAFDLNLNAKSLLKHKDQGFNIIYGIKCITMIDIIMTHQNVFMIAGAVSNGLDVDKDYEGLYGDIFLHNDVTVDTFFFLSGFLLSTSMAKSKKISNLFNVIFNRYVRLIIAYAVIIFYICAIFPYTGSGPLWNRAVQETVYCRQNWWLNILMVNNYVDSENMCLTTSWYIPCDFHFFLISLLLLWIYRKFPYPGKILFVIVTIAAIISPGVITYINELPPTEILTFNLLINLRAGKPFQLTYIKSHTRYAANLVGFFSGFIYTYCSSSERLKKLLQKWSVTGALFGLSTMAVILFTGPLFLWRDYSVLESAVYAALNRPVFSCGVAMFIICCLLGNVPILKGFLSWYPFVPISKLSYGMYLIHAVFIYRNIYVSRSPQLYNYINMITSTFGITCQSLGFAFVIWLLAEAPTLNLLKIFLN